MLAAMPASDCSVQDFCAACRRSLWAQIAVTKEREFVRSRWWAVSGAAAPSAAAGVLNAPVQKNGFVFWSACLAGHT